MKKLNKNEMLKVKGGATWYSASFINAISRASSTLMDIGRSFGSAIRRAISGSICPI